MKSDLKIRTKDYALSVIRLFAELPKKNGNADHGAAAAAMRHLGRCQNP
jgi:hypothetical protein